MLEGLIFIVKTSLFGYHKNENLTIKSEKLFIVNTTLFGYHNNENLTIMCSKV